MKLSRILLSALLISGMNFAYATTPAAPSYTPVQGQAGKDVIWIPTPEGLIDKMLTAAKVTDKDKL
ncbi:MAG: hypothetical protein RJA39_1319, partial [Pseudomonadota bacterium]